jgi:hypothetical protein
MSLAFNMAGLPDKDVILFPGQDDGEHNISDYEDNPNLAAMRPLITAESRLTPSMEVLPGLQCCTIGLGKDAQCVLLPIDELLIRIDGLLVRIKELLLRVDEQVSALRKLDSRYCSYTRSPSREEAEDRKARASRYMPRTCPEDSACSLCPNLKQDW